MIGGWNSTGPSGNVTDEMIQEYIRRQDGTEPDDGGDDFRITKS